MTKSVVRRLLETFFRRWWLYLVPLVLFTGVGIAQGLQSSSGYRAVGVLSVSDETLLSELTQIRGEGFGYETPATSTSNRINSLLGTKTFIVDVAERAGVTDALDRGDTTELALRQAIFASPSGDALVQVQATTEFPELSAALAQSTIESFRQYVIDGDISESRAAEDFFAGQLEVYRDDLEAANQAIQDYAIAHPGPALELRPLDEQVEIASLTNNVDAAEAALAAAVAKGEDARVATAQATGDVAQRLRIVDEAEVPTAPEPRLKQAVLTVALFMVVGLIVSMGMIVLAVLVDRSFKSPEDVEHVLGVPVVAVVPDVAA